MAGSVKLIAAFTELADTVRYPERADENGLREIKRIKARVENERLPQGIDPAATLCGIRFPCQLGQRYRKCPRVTHPLLGVGKAQSHAFQQRV